jgi:hypothetical protein
METNARSSATDTDASVAQPAPTAAAEDHIQPPRKKQRVAEETPSAVAEVLGDDLASRAKKYIGFVSCPAHMRLDTALKATQIPAHATHQDETPTPEEMSMERTPTRPPGKRSPRPPKRRRGGILVETWEQDKCTCKQPTLRMDLVPGKGLIQDETTFRCFECLKPHVDQTLEYRNTMENMRKEHAALETKLNAMLGSSQPRPGAPAGDDSPSH